MPMLGIHGMLYERDSVTPDFRILKANSASPNSISDKTRAICLAFLLPMKSKIKPLIKGINMSNNVNMLVLNKKDDQ
jgi:hypothetical protein